MNKKLLLSALLSILSGCAHYNTTSKLIAESGSGSGAVGSGYDLNNKTKTINVPRSPVISDTMSKQTPSIVKNSERENFDSAEKTEILSYPSINNNAKNKTPPRLDINNDLKNINLQQSFEVFNKKPPANRYSDNKHSNIGLSAHASSAGNPSNYVISGENYKVLPFSRGFVERGIASWYGHDFHGEKTSNGEIYDMNGMTAAHKHLPIPSFVRVTNLKNKRSVVLRINDRGPFYADRVIDLSYKAAQKLDIHQPGTEMVQIETIKTSNKESVYLQLGVFSNPANAQMLQKKVAENKMPEPMVKEVKVDGKPAYRVQLGPIFSAAKVNEFNAKLAKMGISETWYLTENKLN